MKGRYSLPAGWTDYEACGKVIARTRFVAFKTPLRHEYNQALKCPEPKKDDPEKEVCHTARFSPHDCAREIYDSSKGRYKLGLVLNLTFTDKYYNPADFDREWVYFGKIMCPGHEIPNDSLVREFQTSVRNYFYDYPDPSLVIGVHCTHGVNRTGYMIARYLIQVDGWPVEAAIEAVGKARGYPIERENYLAHLRNLDKPSSLYPKVPKPADNPKTGDEPKTGENGSGLQIFDGNDQSSDTKVEAVSHVSSDTKNVHNILLANDEEEDSIDDLSQQNDSSCQDGTVSPKRTLDEPYLEPSKVAKTV